MSGSIEGKLKQLLAKVMRVDPAVITDEASTDTIATWDSLNHMKLVLALEETFDLTLEEAQIEQMTSFKKIVAIVEQARA